MGKGKNLGGVGGEGQKKKCGGWVGDDVIEKIKNKKKMKNKK